MNHSDAQLVQLPIPVTPWELAQTVLTKHHVGSGPVPVRLLAEAEGAHIAYRYMLPDGELRPVSTGYAISINNSLNDRRRRFTLAHELGHLLLDRDFRTGLTSHRCTIAEYLYDGKGKQVDEESFCNIFARHLLLPFESFAEFLDWTKISIPALQERARYLRVSLVSLLWQVLEFAPYEGGFLIFGKMGKPSNPQDEQLRLIWGKFPKAWRMYLPRYDLVPEESPIHSALGSRTQMMLANVKLNFGSLREIRTLLIAEVKSSNYNDLIAIAVPKEVEHIVQEGPRDYTIGQTYAGTIQPSGPEPIAHEESAHSVDFAVGANKLTEAVVSQMELWNSLDLE